MALNIVVCAKQVIDPETPASAFRVDTDARSVIPPQGIPPVVNGFCENAVEAALRIKDANEATVTVISVGSDFVMDVMKKPLSMGADELILLQDETMENLDAYGTAQVLSKAITKVGADLILCGRQASDWDNAQVPLGVAELLNLPCITIAQKVEIGDNNITIERALTDGYQIVQAQLPAVVTVSNELGEPRYPTLRGIMAASKKSPTIWTGTDIGIESSDLASKITLEDLYIPASDKHCEFIVGEGEEDAGRNLALKLREDKLI